MRPPASAPSMLCSASSEPSKFNTPRRSRAASLGVSATRAALIATWPFRPVANRGSNGSPDQGDAPALLRRRPDRRGDRGRQLDRSQLDVAIEAHRLLQADGEPPADAGPRDGAATSVSETVPSASPSRAVTDVGNSSAGLPAAAGRGDRRLALATLRSSRAVGLWPFASRTIPLADMLSGPADQLAIDHQIAVERRRWH